ncbi:DUF4097 family beta strand repeat-containing protein [Edaphobacter bradus]|uniref:DUF4097 family beta strand repeat-containing protein n=1 Tax=Edaphobacter bradus TaxID=2259016 RepID=UPI0021E0D473|nr:DUF4097 family beta strand repeat-containing protein [Edaphobacter bradus]
MANYPPPYPPPPAGPPYGGDWRYQRRVLKQQARMQRDMLRAQRDAYRYQMRSTRRSSILGPLLLIAVGVVFLLIQTGHISARYFWDWYGRFWPILLIGAGVIVLLEWAFDQYFHSDDAIPRRRSLGGGVFALLILFGLAGIFFSGMRHGHDIFGHAMNFDQNNLDEFWGDKHESDQALAQALPAGAAILINNPRGDVTVSGTSDDNQVHIAVHKQVYTRSDSEAGNKAQQLSPAITSEGNTLSVTLPSVEAGRADLVITIPPSAATTVSANHGDVHVNAIKAPVTITANHGDVEASAITGAITTHINNGDSSFSAHSVTGAVSVEGRARDLTLSDIDGTTTMNGDFFGTTHLERIRSTVKFHTSRTDFQLGRLDGEIEISHSDISADQVSGPLTLAVANRNISLDRISGDVSVTNRNGSVDLTSAQPLGNITVENRNGSVNLTMPEHAGFVVQAETTNGDVENDFSLPGEEGGNNRKTINGTIGKGGPLVRISTSQGDIALKKASVAPIPPTPPPPPPPISIHGSDGASVVIGKEGLNISDGGGTKVVIDKNGVNIRTHPDGSSVYVRNGTRLITQADGTRVYVGSDGTHLTTHPDGTKEYVGKDGVKIIIRPNGRTVSSPGKPLTDADIDKRLAEAERDADKAAAERDAARNK